MNRQRCTKHNALVHDFFISYRVSTDKITAEKLASHIDEKRKSDGSNFLAYLDKNCLIQGLNWEEGFTYGIQNSQVLLLLISQGTINTMIGKARRNEVDNVFKEHKEALKLKENGDRVIVPVLVASLRNNDAGRECYVKLDREAALRQFDTDQNNPDVHARLQEIKQVLAQFFELPTIVNIEPDSISEQVPKILQVWYNEVPHSVPCGCIGGSKKKTVEEPSWFQRSIKYPTQSFRLTFIGALIGFAGVLITLSLLFLNSKSKRHTNLKYGVALGNIAAFVVVMIVSTILCINSFYASNDIMCNSCEAIITGYGSATDTYIQNRPEIQMFADECTKGCVISDPDNYYAYGDCVECLCDKYYTRCEKDYKESLILLVVIGLESLLLIGTVMITTQRIKQAESFAMSLQ